MHSLRGLVASAFLLFIVSCNGLPLQTPQGIGLRRDYQPAYSLAEYEAASAWKKVLCQLIHSGDGMRKLATIARRELAAHRALNDDQTVVRTDSDMQDADTDSLHQSVKEDTPPSVSPSQTSGYSPDASGVIANSRDYDFLPDELNGYAGNSPGCPLLVKASSSITRGSDGIEFLTPGIIITGVVILLLVTIAFFDFMHWIHLYRRRSKPRRRPSMAIFIIDDKAIRYSDEDDYTRKEMSTP